jgi:hypothetical protein
MCPTIFGPCPSFVGMRPTTLGPCPSLIGMCPTILGQCPSLHGVSPTIPGHCPSVDGMCPSKEGVGILDFGFGERFFGKISSQIVLLEKLKFLLKSPAISFIDILPVFFYAWKVSPSLRPFFKLQFPLNPFPAKEYSQRPSLHSLYLHGFCRPVNVFSKTINTKSKCLGRPFRRKSFCQYYLLLFKTILQISFCINYLGRKTYLMKIYQTH